MEILLLLPLFALVLCAAMLIAQAACSRAWISVGDAYDWYSVQRQKIREDSDRAAREPGRYVDCRPKNKQIARNGRPACAGTVGCGGVQPAVLAAVAKRRLTGNLGLDHVRCRSMNSAATQIE